MDAQTIKPSDIPVATGDAAPKTGQPGVVFAKIDDVVRWARTS